MLRRLIERFFRIQVKNKQELIQFRQKLAIAYAIVGWHCFGVLFYVIMKKEMPDDPEEKRRAFGLLSATPTNMHVYQITGMTLTNEFDIAYKAKVDQIKKESGESENIETDKH